MPEKEGPSRVVVGIVAILVGSLGIHKFMLGQTTPGVIMLLVSIIGCVVGGQVIMAIIGLIEGIMYLTKTDEEFYKTYVVEKKAWF
jgi:TM2 domain-containing membrane protein YozV